jgi:hypothetical protein
MQEAGFHEAHLRSTPIRALGLQIAGTRLEPIVSAFERELDQLQIRLRPRFYLSTEWGVPFDTVAIAIPFYLTKPELLALHAEQTGIVEGLSDGDILKYLRHEMGHVINYGYRLYDEREWVKLFGSITQPYVEEYRPQPFSRRYVRHLPGWYAQKHPDEDWAETFAVWMTPAVDWRQEYADRPTVQAKLEYVEQTLTTVREREPLVTKSVPDADVGELDYSLEQYYQDLPHDKFDFPRGLDGSLRAIFEELGPSADAQAPRKPAALLLRRIERDLLINIYTWTGHFPERTRLLVRHLSGRADQLSLGYPEARETQAVVALTTLVTALAMNHVHRGSYLP